MKRSPKFNIELYVVLIFRIFLISVVVFSILIYTPIYSGITSFECFIWCISGFMLICMCPMYFYKFIRITSIDISVLIFLGLIPVMQIQFRTISTYEVVNQLSLAAIYLFVRTVSEFSSKGQFVNDCWRATLVVLNLQIGVALLQLFNIIPLANTTFLITGTFENPGPFAIFTAALLVPATFKIINFDWHNKTVDLIISILCLLMGYIILIVSNSRASWLAVFVSFAICLPILYRNYVITKDRRVKIFSFVFLFFAACVFFFILFFYKIDSTYGRILIWRSCLSLVQDHWLTGIGIGNFDVVYSNYQGIFFSKNPDNITQFGIYAGDVRYAFNDLLQVLSETGIVGVGIYLYIVFNVIKALICLNVKQTRTNLLTMYLGSGIIVIVVSGLTTYAIFSLQIAVLFWILIALFETSKRGTIIIDLSYKKENGLLLKAVRCVLFFIPGALLLYISFSRIDSFNKWSHIKHIYTKTSKNKLEKLYPILKDDPEFLYFLGVANEASGNYVEATMYFSRCLAFSSDREIRYKLGKNYEHMKQYNMAYDQYEYVKTSIPNLFLPYYYQAVMYFNADSVSKFQALGKRAILFQPKIESREIFLKKQELKYLLKLKASNETISK